MQVRSPDRSPTPGGRHPRLQAVVTALDHFLRARHAVVEYTRAPDCLFRLQIVCSSTEHRLSDGVNVRAGDRLINLHLWNEQIPPFPAGGPTLAWALRLCRALDVSLRELAFYLAGHHDLADVGAICGNMTLGSAQESDQLVRISERFGFERVATPGSPSLGERMHRLGENILCSMMVLALNPRALRAESLWRGRTLVFLSRRKLEQRYADASPSAFEDEQNHAANLVSAGSRV